MKQRLRSEVADVRARSAPRRRMVRPVMALVFLFGALVCTSAWAGPGGHGGGHGGGGHGNGFHGGGFHGGAHGGHYGGYAGHGRVGVGFFIGAPAYWGYGPVWYGYPYYDYWPAVVTPAPSLWYFCDQPQGYYPTIRQCSTPWRTVTPDAPAPR